MRYKSRSIREANDRCRSRRRGELSILLASLLVILVLTMAACNGASLPQNGGNGDRDCVEDLDCGEGRRCVGGSCESIAGVDCHSEGCGPHSFCDDDGQCKYTGEKSCLHDEDCGEGFVCPLSIRRCMQICLLNADCPSGYTCNSVLGACVECTFDSDCSADPLKPFCLSEEGRCVGCLRPGDCPSNYYCDRLSEDLSLKNTCREGCLEREDCVDGLRCVGVSDHEPGACVECAPETTQDDCTEASAPRCHPDLLMCVRCFEDVHCAMPSAYWCDDESWQCVGCVEDSHCQKGSLCVDKECVTGCKDDDDCPPMGGYDLLFCDSWRGDHGECVECLDTDDCDLGYRCIDGACEEGCSGDDNCPESKPRCDLLAQVCVECIAHDDCAPHRRCDLALKACTCIEPGENCSYSSQCGNPVGWPDLPNWDGVCLGVVWCISEVKCGEKVDDPFIPQTISRCSDMCSIPNRRSECLPDHCCRRIKNTEGDTGLKCVPDTVCAGARCPD